MVFFLSRSFPKWTTYAYASSIRWEAFAVWALFGIEKKRKNRVPSTGRSDLGHSEKRIWAARRYIVFQMCCGFFKIALDRWLTNVYVVVLFVHTSAHRSRVNARSLILALLYFVTNQMNHNTMVIDGEVGFSYKSYMAVRIVSDRLLRWIWFLGDKPVV